MSNNQKHVACIVNKLAPYNYVIIEKIVKNQYLFIIDIIEVDSGKV